METPNTYESCCMQEVMGDTLRPGGFTLTDFAVNYCALTPRDSVLDLGCGRGATVKHLSEKYSIEAIGIDPSEKLIGDAEKSFGFASFVRARGEELPFEDESFNCVLAECTLSLMDADAAIAEAQRVLKKNGWFVISDVYAKNLEAAEELRGYSLNSCMRGLHDLEKLKSKLEKAGFSIDYLEDCSHYLKELLVKIGFSYGSMCQFWNTATDNCVSGDDFYRTLKQCKPGYFLLIVRKRGTADE